MGVFLRNSKKNKSQKQEPRTFKNSKLTFISIDSDDPARDLLFSLLKRVGFDIRGFVSVEVSLGDLIGQYRIRADYKCENKTIILRLGVARSEEQFELNQDCEFTIWSDYETQSKILYRHETMSTESLKSAIDTRRLLATIKW